MTKLTGEEAADVPAGDAGAPAAGEAAAGGSKAMIAVVIAVIIVVAAVAVVFMMPSDDDGNPGVVDQSTATPEQLVDAFIYNLENGKITDALNYSIVSLMSQTHYDQVVDSAEFGDMENITLEMSNLTVTEKANMTDDEKNETQAVIDKIMDDYDLDLNVTDFYVIKADLKVTETVTEFNETSGENETTNQTIELEWDDVGVQIDGKWYILGKMWLYKQD